jgi:hypothetical protein
LNQPSTGSASFAARLVLTATEEFAATGAGVTGADVVGLLMAAAAFTESLELTATVEFAVLDARVTGADVVGLLRNIFKKLLNRPERLGPERPRNCGCASTAQAKNTTARSTCNTESKTFTVRTYSVFLFAEYHLGRRNTSK